MRKEGLENLTLIEYIEGNRDMVTVVNKINQLFVSWFRNSDAGEA